MAEMRLFVVSFCALFALFLVGDVENFPNNEHNIHICANPDKPKILLASIPVNITGKFLQIQKKTVVFPFQGVNDKKITCISVFDRDPNSTFTGGYPRIQSGGVGYYDVIIVLTSQRSQPLQFGIDIYADKKR